MTKISGQFYNFRNIRTAGSPARCYCLWNLHWNAYWLSTKCVLASDLSPVRSWLVQPSKSSSAAWLCAGRVCIN